MIIDKIHIENFGKLSNFTLSLSSGLNELHKENGFGKTTLSIFIKVMFYGMPAARENLKMERKKYSPWQGGDFGGYIEYTTEEGRYRLTRFFGKTPENDTFELFDLTQNKILDKPKVEVGEQVFGVGKETFEITTFFPQNAFQSYANNQISANILGLDKLKFDIANLNIAIDKIKKKESEIKKSKPNKDEIAVSRNHLKSLENQLDELRKRFENSHLEIEALKDEAFNKAQFYEELKKQNDLQQELFMTKEQLEKEVLSLSAQLNSLYLEQEKLENNRQALLKDKPKNYKFFKNMLLVLGVVLFLVPVIIACLSIIKIYVAVIISLTVLFLTGILYYVVNKKNNNSEFNEKIGNINKERDVLNHKILLTRELLQRTQQELKSYENLTKNDGLFLKTKDEMNNLNLQIERQIILQEEYIKDIDRLIEDIENIKDELLNFEIRESEINKKIALLSKTKEILLQAHQNVSKRFVDPVNNSINDILKTFDLKGRNFVVDTNFELKQITEKGIKELDYSSQGIKDILYFCMRIYFIKEIYKKERPFIILDDTFVNLDDQNLAKIREILKQLSQEFQIIYNFCHIKSSIKNS